MSLTVNSDPEDGSRVTAETSEINSENNGITEIITITSVYYEYTRL